MKPQVFLTLAAGAVIVDMAVEAGGNCEMSKLGEVVTTPNGVKIVGYPNLAVRLAEIASGLFGKNILNFLTPHVDKETGGIAFDWEDETGSGTRVTKDGKVVNERVAEALKAAGGKKPAAKKPAAKKPAAKKASTKASAGTEKKGE